MKILIPTMPSDRHATTVHLALKELGYDSYLWYTADFPTQQRHHFELKNGNVIWSSLGTNFKICDEYFDIVWYRRPRKPIMSDVLHPDDVKNAISENMLFFQTIWHVVAPNAKWINPPTCALRANCKLLQLKIAHQVGLNVPSTIFSNNPEKIKEFIQENRAEDVIYKPFASPVWVNNNNREARLTYTKIIRLTDLPDDYILQMTPGIFQKKIPKAFELRVTMMGNYPMSVKINSQKHPKGITDWRYIPTNELSIEKFDLPKDITEKCIALMDKMGLVFGCFDFIVTPDKEYYFLEINEQGQFLWIEDIDPNIKMLDSFVNFLINNMTALHGKSHSYLSSANFYTEVDNQTLLAMKLHKDPDKFM